MTSNQHNIDLASDVTQEVEVREHDDRLALEEKLRSLAAEAGFDPDHVRLTGSTRRKTRKAQQTNGAPSHE